jgi:hypothetical protein
MTTAGVSFHDACVDRECFTLDQTAATSGPRRFGELFSLESPEA